MRQRRNDEDFLVYMLFAAMGLILLASILFLLGSLSGKDFFSKVAPDNVGQESHSNSSADDGVDHPKSSRN